MKFFLFLLIAGGVGYYFYTHAESQKNPEVIEAPVYAEFRMQVKKGGREIDMALFGEMASDEDCRSRAEEFWEKLIDGCADCSIKLSSCKPELEPRYRKLFDDKQIYSTYVSFTRASRYERNGRMVVYGLTSDEGDKLCDAIVKDFDQRYAGTVRCVHGRRD